MMFVVFLAGFVASVAGMEVPPVPSCEGVDDICCKSKYVCWLTMKYIAKNMADEQGAEGANIQKCQSAAMYLSAGCTMKGDSSNNGACNAMAATGIKECIAVASKYPLADDSAMCVQNMGECGGRREISLGGRSVTFDTYMGLDMRAVIAIPVVFACLAALAATVVKRKSVTESEIAPVAV